MPVVLQFYIYMYIYLYIYLFIYFKYHHLQHSLQIFTLLVLAFQLSQLQTYSLSTAI